ncbi:hypothetical protein PpBr36_05076 [Pyricularia pennisetigena]|uniref:hypothetical protein n=1 Tax=Pyricularia pennisetigena TaxID=1578925 RepID=UPI00114EC74F|nr:hypothetical protein PpBr36_05076 [Pyricularia pennisetigena]TLS26948.1 hypothetical protein PpBr36_05076 [Pyricularia pennisetigena]
MPGHTSSSPLVNLPLDVLVLIFPRLDAKSFLALCSTCKAFQQPSIRLDPSYWSALTRDTFRVPNQPIVQHDGLRWQRMYRRLLRDARAFTWGENGSGRLGRNSRQVPDPNEMDAVRGLGIIADMQCGGWSTTLLTSTGELYSTGVLDGESMYYGTTRTQATRLGFPDSRDQNLNPATLSIRQFSSGRKHILGLSDTGRIWSWHDSTKPARHILLSGVDITEIDTPQTSGRDRGRVKRVVAGWSRSSAYIQGHGIVVWRDVFGIMDRRGGDGGDDIIDNDIVIPRTSYQHGIDLADQSEADRAVGQEVGVVCNHIVLADFVVFVTDLGKVFCVKLQRDNQVEDILELRALRSKDSVVDIQGSHLRFGVLKRDEVVIVHQDYLQACWDARGTNPEQTGISGLLMIPALQKGDVISLAFGDYHFLALHANGRITSYGTECYGCGSLGFGYPGGAGFLRGVRTHRGDCKLLPHAYTNGRRVVFGEAMMSWLSSMRFGGPDPEEAMDRARSVDPGDMTVQGEVSEWIEQQLQVWEDLPDQIGDDGLGRYFALGVCAAGWHSGALLLVNDELGNEIPEMFRDMRFPRLRLSDGREMEGTKDFDDWPFGRPEWDLSIRL